MASNDSGVDTSNDSNCTNDNNNSNNASNSWCDGTNKNTSTIEFTQALDRIAQKLTSTDQMPTNSNTTSSIHEYTRYKAYHRIPRSSSCGKKPTQYTLAPYVKALKERKLRMASCVSNIDQLVGLLESGVSPNAADEHHRSPLHLAASRGTVST